MTINVLAACSLKSGGTSTLLLALAGAVAASGRNIRIIDMARNGDLLRWSRKRGCPSHIQVVAGRHPEDLEREIVAGLREKALILIDPGVKAERIRVAARYVDPSLIPVRFSPLSAYWALETDRMLHREPDLGKPRRRALVATAITFIPSRVARTVEAQVARARSEKLPIGLALRAAQEAPFLIGGTLFNLSEDAVSGIEKARADTLALARRIDLLAPADSASPRVPCDPRPFDRMPVTHAARPLPALEANRMVLPPRSLPASRPDAASPA